MKLIYAPSGKRMIPYPPVGIALLAGALSSAGVQAQLVDLEMLTWKEQQETKSLPLYEGILNAPAILRGDYGSLEQAYQRRLFELAGVEAGEDIAISVMGFEQVSSALLLTLLCLSRGSRVILGGQFWSDSSATETLTAVNNGRLTVVVGDGWDAIVEWATSPQSVPSNGFEMRGGTITKGTAVTRMGKPPEPDYSTLDWEPYVAYARGTLRDPRPIRRAHLYVWDKLCPYKCNFCRVSSGSKAQLTAPEGLRASLRGLLQLGVSQLNFMTNELNPSLSYMRRVINALSPDLAGRDDIGWFTYLRPDAMDFEDLQALRSIGCRLVRYGVETGSQRLSDKMQKEYDIPTVERVLRDAANADIMNHVNILVGYPGETEDDVLQTMQFIDRNCDVIHSIRINPFYLPPGSKLALKPQEYGLRLTTFQRGYWDFELVDGTCLSSDIIKERIEAITGRIKSYGIGFAATLPFETLNELTRYRTRDEALRCMRRSHPFMWQTASSDELKAHIGGYAVHADWKSTIYQRGRNYSLTVCTD